jgi:hypothetical protein
MTQGSRCAATLGFGPESRWDSKTRASVHLKKDAGQPFTPGAISNLGKKIGCKT